MSGKACLSAKVGTILVMFVGTAGAQVQMGPQVRVDVTGGITSANETSMASSIINPAELVASWNDHRLSGTVCGGFAHVGAGVSMNGGATWTDGLIRPPSLFQTNFEFDPMTAYDDPTVTGFRITMKEDLGLFGDLNFLVPEPTTFLLMALGSLGVIGRRQRRSRIAPNGHELRKAPLRACNVRSAQVEY